MARQNGDVQWNIDHIVVTLKGLLVIETKARSKIDDVYKADYDGTTLRIGGVASKNEAIDQVKASVGDVRRYLERITGDKPFIRAVVLYPGWFITPIGDMRADGRTWVLNPKMLAVEIQREPDRISRQEAALYAERLRQWSREGAANAKAKAK